MNSAYLEDLEVHYHMIFVYSVIEQEQQLHFLLRLKNCRNYFYILYPKKKKSVNAAHSTKQTYSRHEVGTKSKTFSKLYSSTQFDFVKLQSTSLFKDLLNSLLTSDEERSKTPSARSFWKVDKLSLN